MAKRLKIDQKYGLTNDQIVAAERFLRKKPDTTAISQHDAAPLYEMFMLDYSFDDIASKFSQYEYGYIIYIAAIGGWVRDREKIAATIYDRIKARVVRSTVEQVEFLTDMIAVSSKESADEVKKYLQNPMANPPPQMRIKSFKDYQQVVEMLVKVTETVRAMSTPQNEPKRVSSKRSKSLAASSVDPDSIILAELAKESPE